MPTALQIAQGRQVPLTTGLFMAVRDETPLLSAFDARTSSDDKFLSLAVVALPTSRFVNLGEGLTADEGILELREFSCSAIGGLVKAEVESARLWDKHHQAAGYTWFDLQTLLRLKADLRNIERQMILGTANDAKGFPGAKEMTPFLAGNTLTLAQQAQAYEFKRAVTNVGGTTANTASSVYSFVFGELESQLVIGNDTGAELVTISDSVRQMIAPNPAEPAKLSLHDVAEMRGYIGLSVNGFNLQVAGQNIPAQYSVRRLANVTADNNCKLTDAMIDKLRRGHGSGRRPGLFAMSARSGEQLAASRAPVAINFNMGQSGDAQAATYTTYPPPPDNWNGIPIVYPDCIGDSDAIEV